MIALAVDLGGSHASCGVIRDGTVLGVCSIPADGRRALASLLPDLRRTLGDLMKTAEIGSSDPAALVLGFCGIVSARERRILATNGKFEDATALDLCGWCSSEFGVPFLLENDARLALLGEHAYGAARGAEDAVMITLGSGIGGAALIRGRLIESRHGLAGTIGGHLPVVLEGRLCSCGNRGCAEAEASTTVLAEVYREQSGSNEGLLHGRERIGFAELFEAVDREDKVAIAALDHCLRVWSSLTVALVHAYDPEVVVLGGSVMQREDAILPRLQEHVRAHAWTPGRTVPLRRAALGSEAALLGAIPLIEAYL